jgi:hypothetical protein
LYERFPESAVESGVCVVMNMSKSASGEGGVQLAFMGAPWNRPCVLGWLEMLRHRTGVTVRDSSLEWDDGGLRCRVSRETGLLEEASSESDEGRMQLRLREGQIDCKLASELVDLPDAARNARVDAELTRRFAFNRNSWRRLAFLHVESQAESGKRDWSELARNDWHEVMDALHRQAIAKSYAKTLSDLRTQIETVSELAREDAEKDKSEENRAEVQKKVAEQRAKMEEALTGLRTSYVDSLPAIEPERHEPRQDLFDTEKEVIDDLWKELILDPLLAYFDEKFAEALGK